jgi:teichuronic acid biosynthesis glycosyltransferase TuaG
MTGDTTTRSAHPGRVSVIMPVYNAERTLQASIDSVLCQSHRDVELLLIDDGSRDASWAMIEAAAASDPRVVPVRQSRNGGVAAARNAGIAAASGRFVAFLDSDDTWMPQKLEVQLAAMAQSGSPVSYASYQRVDEAGNPLSIVVPPEQVDYRAMLRSNRIGNLTGIYDRVLGDGAFQRIGHEDYAFWLQMVHRAGHAVRAGDATPLARYLVRAGSLSSDKFKAARWQWRIYREIECLGRITAAWYFAHYVAIAFWKRR